jgi:hypothetical protein
MSRYSHPAGRDQVTEKQFMATVIEMARAFGWRSFHTFDSRRSAPGFPDLVLVKPPRVVVAELKRETGRLSSEQAEWIALLERCPGVEYHVWRSGNLTLIEASLRVPAGGKDAGTPGEGAGQGADVGASVPHRRRS